MLCCHESDRNVFSFGIHIAAEEVKKIVERPMLQCRMPCTSVTLVLLVFVLSAQKRLANPIVSQEYPRSKPRVQY